MTKFIVASGAALPFLYVVYFYFAVKWRLENDRKARSQKRRELDAA